MQCMVCSKPVWTSGDAEKRKREAFIPAIIDEASFKAWCDLSRRILESREQYHGSADMSISAEGMSLERFQKFVMGWLKDTMACKLILCLSDKQTISTPTEFRNRRIIRYHGFAQEHTFRISYEYDVENWFDFFSLHIDCDYTFSQHGAIEEDFKKTHSCSIVKKPADVSELPDNLRGILNLFEKKR